MNRFLVAAVGDKVVMLNPPGPRQTLVKDDALNLVAWILTLADISDDELQAARAAVENF